MTDEFKTLVAKTQVTAANPSLSIDVRNTLTDCASAIDYLTTHRQGLGRAAQARRFYHHVLNGGTLKPRDVARMVETIEELENELQIERAKNDPTA